MWTQSWYQEEEERSWMSTDLIWIIDGNFEAPQGFTLQWVLIDGQLKLVLWPTFSIEGRWVIVKVYHPDDDRGGRMSSLVVFWTNFRSLQQTGKEKGWGILPSPTPSWSRVALQMLFLLQDFCDLAVVELYLGSQARNSARQVLESTMMLNVSFLQRCHNRYKIG